MSISTPKKLDYSLPEEIGEQVRRNIPGLFSGRYRSVLYVGASHLRQHFLSDFVESYDAVTVLEIFGKNVEYLKGMLSGTGADVIQGDVRDARRCLGHRFDVCFFYHGPEHLKKKETGGVLSMLESMTNHIVVLGMPYGRYEQGSEYGNENETHHWDIYPQDMHGLGYETDTLGDADDTLSNMIAWKYVSGQADRVHTKNMTCASDKVLPPISRDHGLEDTVFVYGTLKDEIIRTDVLGRCVPAQECALKGYKLSSVKIEGMVYTALVPDADGYVSGEMFDATLAEIGRIDEYETDYYSRIRVRLENGRDAWTYVKATNRSSAGSTL